MKGHESSPEDRAAARAVNEALAEVNAEPFGSVPPIPKPRRSREVEPSPETAA